MLKKGVLSFILDHFFFESGLVVFVWLVFFFLAPIVDNLVEKKNNPLCSPYLLANSIVSGGSPLNFQTQEIFQKMPPERERKLFCLVGGVSPSLEIFPGE